MLPAYADLWEKALEDLKQMYNCYDTNTFVNLLAFNPVLHIQMKVYTWAQYAKYHNERVEKEYNETANATGATSERKDDLGEKPGRERVEADQQGRNSAHAGQRKVHQNQ